MAATETAHSAASASQSAKDKAGAAQSRQSSAGRKGAQAPPDPCHAPGSKADSGPASTDEPGARTASNDGPVPTWDDMVRQGTVLRLMEHLNVGVQLAADLGKDPAFSADDRLQAVLVAARMITANAHLGRAIGYLAQVEQRRRTVVQHIDPPAVWSGSNSNPEVLLERELILKMLRYMKAVADETFDPAIAEAEAAEQEKAAKDQPARAAATGTVRTDGATAQA